MLIQQSDTHLYSLPSKSLNLFLGDTCDQLYCAGCHLALAVGSLAKPQQLPKLICIGVRIRVGHAYAEYDAVWDPVVKPFPKR